MQLNDDSLDKTLSFEDLLGIQYKNLKFTDILSAATAIRMGFDAVAKHQSYRPFLPTGTPDDYRSYKYALLVDSNGQNVYVGIPWVKPASIIENNSPTKIFRFPSLTPDQENSLRLTLTASGIEDFTVETV